MSHPHRPVDLRRAMLGHLLAVGAPVSVRDVVAALAHEFGAEAVDSKRSADMLRYQVGLGRVRRVARGHYQIVPAALSKTMAWRCRNWRAEQEREYRRRLRCV